MAGGRRGARRRAAAAGGRRGEGRAAACFFAAGVACARRRRCAALWGARGAARARARNLKRKRCQTEADRLTTGRELRGLRLACGSGAEDFVARAAHGQRAHFEGVRAELNAASRAAPRACEISLPPRSNYTKETHSRRTKRGGPEKTSGRFRQNPTPEQKVKHCMSLHDVKRCQTQPARHENDATVAEKKRHPWRAASRAPREAGPWSSPQHHQQGAATTRSASRSCSPF